MSDTCTGDGEIKRSIVVTVARQGYNEFRLNYYKSKLQFTSYLYRCFTRPLLKKKGKKRNKEIKKSRKLFKLILRKNMPKSYSIKFLKNVFIKLIFQQSENNFRQIYRNVLRISLI